MTGSIDERAAFELGLNMRKAVLGAKHVERQGGINRDEASALQQYVTQFGWGTLWQRGVLPLKVRSMATVSMLIALNRPHELTVHLKGALRNGCTEEELREVILHSIAYCGFPAAIDAMRLVDSVLAEVATDAEDTQ
jgi:4-carboxymuconolactone decarboxylase